MLVSDTAITAESRLKLMQGSFVSTKVLSLEKSKMAGDLLEYIEQTGQATGAPKPGCAHQSFEALPSVM